MSVSPTPPSTGFFSFPRQDILAGFVVFLVALPLCLGIAIACGLPPVAGLVAGVVGGLVVPIVSRSPLSVTGPAAGLTSIVLFEVARLGGIVPFLAAVVVAGVLQVGFGLLRSGRFSALVPSSAIKGMLAAIGITIVVKQLPLAFGADGGFAVIHNTWHGGATLLAVASVALLLIWPRTPLKRIAFVPPALVVVVLGTVFARLFVGTSLELEPNDFVIVPAGGIGGLWAALSHPVPADFLRSDVWIAGATIAIVASIETLLSVQAVDRLDPLRRRTPTDRELIAQGIGNTVSGLLGGLPITAVIVRSSANVTAGGRERLSAVVHAVLLLGAVVLAAPLLSMIPMAALAAVLIVVGVNLAKPSTFIQQAKLGIDQLAPFIVTIVAVLATDLLKGVVIGVVVALGFTLHQNSKGAITKKVDADGTVRLAFRRDATFLTKPALLRELDTIESGGRVVVSCAGEYVDLDVKEALVHFRDEAHAKNVQVTIDGVDLPTAVAGH